MEFCIQQFFVVPQNFYATPRTFSTCQHGWPTEAHRQIAMANQKSSLPSLASKVVIFSHQLHRPCNWKVTCTWPFLPFFSLLCPNGRDPDTSLHSAGHGQLETPENLSPGPFLLLSHNLEHFLPLSRRLLRPFWVLSCINIYRQLQMMAINQLTRLLRHSVLICSDGPRSTSHSCPNGISCPSGYAQKALLSIWRT